MPKRKKNEPLRISKYISIKVLQAKKDRSICLTKKCYNKQFKNNVFGKSNQNFDKIFI